MNPELHHEDGRLVECEVVGFVPRAGQTNIMVRWVDRDGAARTDEVDGWYPRNYLGGLPRVGQIMTLEAAGAPEELTNYHDIPYKDEPVRDELRPQAELLATVLRGRLEQLARKGESMTTMTLEATVVGVGKEPKDNILRVQVPGEERPRLARFEPGQVRGENLALAPGATVDAEVALVPSERIEIRAVAAVGALGARDTQARRVGDTDTLEEIAPLPAEQLPPGLRYVGHDPLYLAPAELKEYGLTMEKLSRRGVRVMGELIGPAGCGKTSWAYDFAATNRRPFAKFDMGTIVSPDQLLGHREFRDGRTEYIVSQLVLALGTERAVIFLDEINRISPSNSGPLFPLLDHTGEVWSDYLQTRVTVHPSVVIFGASNRGASFTGTFVMDEALESRFQYPIEVSYPDPKVEAKILEGRCGTTASVARALVDFATEVRKKADPDRNDALERSISTRACIAVGHLVGQGMKPFAAVERCILPRYSTEGGANSPRQTVLKILQGKFAS